MPSSPVICSYARTAQHLLFSFRVLPPSGRDSEAQKKVSGVMGRASHAITLFRAMSIKGWLARLLCQSTAKAYRDILQSELVLATHSCFAIPGLPGSCKVSERKGRGRDECRMQLAALRVGHWQHSGDFLRNDEAVLCKRRVRLSRRVPRPELSGHCVPAGGFRVLPCAEIRAGNPKSSGSRTNKAWEAGKEEVG
ncbi:hypothetical protein CH063_15256 [Colletotrichum higginsianum]|uniref:Uncharacterized protein n=1 Tax=Colletotrichum higginsianum (strain IMI 349063) TaxID=759273 RepID=H1W223_COLHI|nr:hypothetical protein CH063_15256 [Colletotrichum higginsianum]